MEDAQTPGTSETGESAELEEVQAHSTLTAAKSVPLVETQSPRASRAGELEVPQDTKPPAASRSLQDAQSQWTVKAQELAKAEEKQALKTWRAEESVVVVEAQAAGILRAEVPPTVEAGEPSTSESRPHGGLALDPSSSDGRTLPKKRKASVLSTSKSRGKPAGAKKKRARKVSRQPAPKYFIHETDNDMLLIISNDCESIADLHPSRKATKRKKKASVKKKSQQGAKAKAPRRPRKPAADPRTNIPCPDLPRGCQDGGPADPLLKCPGDGRWGEQLPVEILVRIFHFLVGSDGAVPSLCRISRVCRLWQGAAANPILWQKVSMSFCWTAPQKKLQPQNQRRVLSTLEWLAANRFSLLREFSLHHWKTQVPLVTKTLAQSCCHLTSLKLSHCSGVTTECLVTVAEQCPKLESLNLQNSQVDSTAVVKFLEASGLRIRRLWLTYGTRLNSIFAMLSSGRCSELRFLEVTTEIKQGTDYLEFSIEALQAGCPKLQVLHLLNVIWSPKSRSRNRLGASGFPDLEELSLATSSFSFVGDNECLRILQTSTKLRVLDLRGCYRITPNSLQKLPCTDLENLYLGLYCSYNNVGLQKEGSHLITWKWPHSLRELDLMGQGFYEEDLELALAALARDGNNPMLRSLNLAGTKVTLKSVRDVIQTCPLLTYLNLTSCRCLPRGMKRVYSGCQDIQQCLQKLECSSGDSTDMPETMEGATRKR